MGERSVAVVERIARTPCSAGLSRAQPAESTDCDEIQRSSPRVCERQLDFEGAARVFGVGVFRGSMTFGVWGRLGRGRGSVVFVGIDSRIVGK